MGMTSAAEAKLEARIRPDITMMRASTPYPKRRLAVAGEAGSEEARTAAAATQAAGQQAAGAAVAGTAADGTAADGTAADGTAAAGTVAAGTGEAPGRSSGRGAVPAGGPALVRASAGSPARTARKRPAAPGPIRLTRRGRIVVGVLVVIGVVAAVGLLWLVIAGQARAASGAAPGKPAGVALRRVVVRPGQTLWSIAVHADPAADPRVVVHEIMEQNGLGGTSIQPGQILWVPRG